MQFEKSDDAVDISQTCGMAGGFAPCRFALKRLLGATEIPAAASRQPDDCAESDRAGWPEAVPANARVPRIVGGVPPGEFIEQDVALGIAECRRRTAARLERQAQAHPFVAVEIVGDGSHRRAHQCAHPEDRLRVTRSLQDDGASVM